MKNTSALQLTFARGRTKNDRTFAALYKLNKWAYDWQFRAGLSGNDVALAGPADGSFCLSPSATVSVLNNVDLNLLGQIFHGKQGALIGSAPDIAAISLKWSF